MTISMVGIMGRVGVSVQDSGLWSVVADPVSVYYQLIALMHALIGCTSYVVEEFSSV